MSERFFVEPFITSGRATLSGSEVHHLAGVMRAKVGDEITLFDGSGSEFTARIELLKKDRCELAVLSQQPISREPAVAITAGVALPKGDRQKWLVEKLTELGVTRLVPLLTRRGVVQPGEQAASRLKRSVIEASKQCGRNRLLDISQPVQATEWFATEQNPVRLLADPSGEPMVAHHAQVQQAGEVLFAVGPEGGFTAEEIAAAKDAGWLPVSLGRSILRIETAAIALSAACIAIVPEKGDGIE